MGAQPWISEDDVTTPTEFTCSGGYSCKLGSQAFDRNSPQILNEQVYLREESERWDVAIERGRLGDKLFLPKDVLLCGLALLKT